MKKNLLIVDDEEAILELLVDLLSARVDKVYTATNVVDAINIYINEDINCIISDYKLGDENGLDFLARIRRLDRNIPFIFLSEFGTADIIQKSLEYNIFDFIEKSNINELLKTLFEAYYTIECVSGKYQNDFSEIFDNDVEKFLKILKKRKIKYLS